MVWLRLPVPNNRARPSLFLTGDSTARPGQRGGGDGTQWGWSDYLAPYFDTEKINGVNRAVGGTGVQTFRATLGANTLRLMKAGDAVMFHFDRNGQPTRGPAPRPRRGNRRTRESRTKQSK